MPFSIATMVVLMWSAIVFTLYHLPSIVIQFPTPIFTPVFLSCLKSQPPSGTNTLTPPLSATLRSKRAELKSFSSSAFSIFESLAKDKPERIYNAKAIIVFPDNCIIFSIILSSTSSEYDNDSL